MQRLVVAFLLAVLLAGTGQSSALAEQRPIGVLIADHGEPPVYNAHTYWSIRAFIDHLMDMGVIPSWLRAVDNGTITQDETCYDCADPSLSPRLIDAWLRSKSGPAAYVPRSSESLPAHYVAPAGDGLSEPDIFEHGGLQTWDEWQRMGGRSPNYGEKLVRKREVARRLRASYGDRLVVRTGYGIDPRIGGRRQGLRQAVEALVERDRVRAIVVAYHGIGFSDLMQTHMIRHEILDAVNDLGANVPIRFTEPLGRTSHYVQAVVDKVRTELSNVPAKAPVAIHLSGHGLPTSACGDYDCGADAYHGFARDLFRRVSRAVLSDVRRPGRFGVFHVYGDGGEGDADPDDKVDSPLEALSKRKAQGFRYVIDVPYEFEANSRDTLIVLRSGYGRASPDWNSAYESRFTYQGVHVKIANAFGGDAHKVAALEGVIRSRLHIDKGAPTSHTGHH
ncbi:MAG TPA: hypothetical protein VFA34_14945 [Actinomycetota bacterium]|jgi:hypothetical protein|nr:hypothetical protein [Actinomycetota bacterium]